MGWVIASTGLVSAIEAKSTGAAVVVDGISSGWVFEGTFNAESIESNDGMLVAVGVTPASGTSPWGIAVSYTHLTLPTKA